MTASNNKKVTNPRLVIILSGKRKSGKDHISKLIADHIGPRRVSNDLAVLRIAGPIKQEFARNNELDFSRLLDSSEYKENYRRAMVDWSEQYRATKGWNCFLEQSIEEQMAKAKAIWILTDARRLCDIEFFEKSNDSRLLPSAKIIKLRIEAKDEVRESRGWHFVGGIDDRDTECGLDSYKDWTVVLQNNSNNQEKELLAALRPVFSAVDAALS